MIPDLETLKFAAQLGGGWLAFFVLLILHREDRQKRNEIAARLLDVVERNAAVNEKMSGVVERLSEALTEHHHVGVSWMDKVATVVDKTHHGVATLVDKANAEAWARKGAQP